MGRRVQADPVACRLVNSRQHMGTAAFTIRTGYVNTPKLVLRVTQGFAQPQGITQPGFEGLRSNPVKDGEPTV